MVNVLSRRVIYKPVLVGDEKIKLYLLEMTGEDWIEERKRRSKHMIDRLLAHANNIVIMNPVEEGYVFAEAETPGLKAFVGEGGFREAETILLPKPEPIKSIKLYRLGEKGELKLVHEYTPPRELWGYETKIDIDPSIEYDLIIVETPDKPRPILPTELPIRKTGKTRKKKKSRRKSRRRRRRKRSGRKRSGKK